MSASERVDADVRIDARERDARIGASGLPKVVPKKWQ
jgi:hypothetical protein